MGFSDLPIDVINYMMLTCDYKSILFMYCTCKLVNNIDLETILITKSRLIKNIIGNTDHFIPRSIIYSEKSKLTYDDMIISCLNYLLNNNIDIAYGDRIVPDNKKETGYVGSMGFPGRKDIITFRGIVINPTYKIFQKFLTFKYHNFSVFVSKNY